MIIFTSKITDLEIPWIRFRRPQSRPRVTAAAPEVDSVESNEIAEAAAAAPAPSTTTQRTRLFSPQRRTRFREAIQ